MTGKFLLTGAAGASLVAAFTDSAVEVEPTADASVAGIDDPPILKGSCKGTKFEDYFKAVEFNEAEEKFHDCFSCIPADVNQFDEVKLARAFKECNGIFTCSGVKFEDYAAAQHNGSAERDYTDCFSCIPDGTNTNDLSKFADAFSGTCNGTLPTPRQDSCKDLLYDGVQYSYDSTNVKCEFCYQYGEGDETKWPERFLHNCGGKKPPPDSCSNTAFKDRYERRKSPCGACMSFQKDLNGKSDNTQEKLLFTRDCGGSPLPKPCGGYDFATVREDKKFSQCGYCIDWNVARSGVSAEQAFQDSQFNCNGNIPEPCAKLSYDAIDDFWTCRNCVENTMTTEGTRAASYLSCGGQGSTPPVPADDNNTSDTTAPSGSCKDTKYYDYITDPTADQYKDCYACAGDNNDNLAQEFVRCQGTLPCAGRRYGHFVLDEPPYYNERCMSCARWFAWDGNTYDPVMVPETYIQHCGGQEPEKDSCQGQEFKNRNSNAQCESCVTWGHDAKPEAPKKGVFANQCGGDSPDEN